ncbi:unnamed protein product [Heligmosomoides polygyrus]|uniref:Uncharacterized protein n=1 Tax=Heligmosomoides polygyrus TaxID=6339 RepID=A0A183FL52_HELPZ|nr:unnamed protein product [Heligmosomoides polygyrus]
MCLPLSIRHDGNLSFSFALLQKPAHVVRDPPPKFRRKKAIQIDRSQIERMVGDLEKAPPPPVDAPPAPQLPYWFTTECRNNLVNCDVPAMSVPSAPSPIPPPLPMPDLKQQLKAQLEYYFSR